MKTFLDALSKIDYSLDMAKIVNSYWQSEMMHLINTAQPIDETIAFAPAVSWLVLQLARANRNFKIHNFGAGVKRVTTQTDTCPCCKKKL